MTFFDDVASAQSQLIDLEKAVIGALDEASEAGAEILEIEVKHSVPIGSGDLLRSIKKRADKKGRTFASWRVYADIFYAIFVEYGTSKMRPRAFMRKSVARSKRATTYAMEKAIKAKTDKVIR